MNGQNIKIIYNRMREIGATWSGPHFSRHYCGRNGFYVDCLNPSAVIQPDTLAVLARRVSAVAAKVPAPARDELTAIAGQVKEALQARLGMDVVA